MMFERGIEIKTPAQIKTMRAAGLVVAETLEVLRESAVAGVTTRELDAIAHEHIRSRGASSNFLGYHGFTGVICTSVNDEVVHGIPGSRVLRDGDIISIDCGAVVDGWHGDAATTVAIGDVPDEVLALMRVTEESMWRGIAAARLGGRVSDISHAIETTIVGAGDYGIVEGFTGHGIGSQMHQPPDVHNYGKPRRGAKLVKGLALAVEPMVTLGTSSTRILDDDWTAVTTDGSWAAHYEHTFTLTDNGAWVLTALDGGKTRLAELGVPYGGD
ncbi:type I methionyl aminopeptidase [Aeromicrobium sp. SMF47]|uniref:type I methionyl aminopeptidase n=1 Tax=Aeromicrobium yanjiei TaxID=2662028 RepID=UPI00129D446C|nr:type I methionyl aminopeptidase [Aeromicrobium yanjiei]